MYSKSMIVSQTSGLEIYKRTTTQSGSKKTKLRMRYMNSNIFTNRVEVVPPSPSIWLASIVCDC